MYLDDCFSSFRSFIPKPEHAGLHLEPLGIHADRMWFGARQHDIECLANLHDIVTERSEAPFTDAANLTGVDARKAAYFSAR